MIEHFFHQQFVDLSNQNQNSTLVDHNPEQTNKQKINDQYRTCNRDFRSPDILDDDGVEFTGCSCGCSAGE